ncbi:hypothetical protein E1301_Tti004895 [Triplophysa tibetana]|uniref:Uncharacterized protein n=1 Tax=Triplophysa tibetana TaxID=1572043 RepID=A0A5A9NTD6_9TELE|nr:hypothetical protein E1301_Tti004895 [Triplophysa tibetana]
MATEIDRFTMSQVRLNPTSEAVQISVPVVPHEPANARPQGKNLDMGLLTTHPPCYPLAVLGMLNPERANRTLSRIHGSRPSTKALGAAGRIWKRVARRQCMERQ